MSEWTLKKRLQESLENDFMILSEVEGLHPINNHKVRVDFMLKARNHLVEKGFTDEWFGVECKWASGVIGQTSKITRMFWQSITYAQSIYCIEGNSITPKFVAVFVPDQLEMSIERHFKTLSQLALYGNVGELYFYRDGSWGIKFTYIYARSTGDDYYISEKRLPKRRSGHC